MGFRSKVFLTMFLIFGDIVATTVRPTWDRGGDFDQYLWVAGHLSIAFLEGVMVFAFFSGTIWFTAGLLGEMLFSIKSTFPLWLLHAFFVQMPWTYNFFISADKNQPWNSAIYAALFSLDVAVAVLFWTSMMYTISCMTDRRMYAPYHKEICVQLMKKYQQQQQGIRISSGSGGGSRSIPGHSPGTSMVQSPPNAFGSPQEQPYPGQQHQQHGFASQSPNMPLSQQMSQQQPAFSQGKRGSVLSSQPQHSGRRSPVVTFANS